MNKKDIIDGIKRKGSHGFVVNSAEKEKESAEIEMHTLEFLKNKKNKIETVSAYPER